MGTPMWRPDFRSLSVGDQRRETILAAGFLPWLLRRMRARRRNGRALPASAFKVWLGVRKVHQKRDIGLSPSKVITATVKRLCRKHIKDFGAASLIPKRKEPFTRAMILALLRLADGLRIGPYVLTWDSRVGRALRALIVVLASTGMRKAEVSISSGERFDKTHVSRADLRWRLRGRVYVSPPANLLAAPQPGDCVMLKPPLSKADPFGAVWGASPIYLSYEPNDPLCAFSALAAVEIHDPVDARENTPLLSPDGASPFLAGHLDTMLRAMLVVTVGAAEATKFSWHSMRIWLACSLLASGASHAQIQALCRWRSDEALAIYARLNQTTYAALLWRALVADVNSVRMNQLPDVDAEDVFRSIPGCTWPRPVVARVVARLLLGLPQLCVHPCHGRSLLHHAIALPVFAPVLMPGRCSRAFRAPCVCTRASRSLLHSLWCTWPPPVVARGTGLHLRAIVRLSRCSRAPPAPQEKSSTRRVGRLLRVESGLAARALPLHGSARLLWSCLSGIHTRASVPTLSLAASWPQATVCALLRLSDFVAAAHTQHTCPPLPTLVWDCESLAPARLTLHVPSH